LPKKEKRPKWPKGAIYIPIPMYGGSLFLFTKVKDYEQAYKHLGFSADTKGCDGQFTNMESDSGERLYMILTSDGYDTLHHECSHAALTVVKDVGFNAEDGNQEPFCYLAAHLFTECLKKLKKRKIKLK